MLCNAWGVFDPSSEPPGERPILRQSEPPAGQGIPEAPPERGVDIVFAAGNCGQLLPNPSCDPGFTGPGASINGANALPEVLTVGAVRVDRPVARLFGAGPGVANMAQEKPDLCAPSQFENEDDAGGRGRAPPPPAASPPARSCCSGRDWGPSAVSPAALQGNPAGGCGAAGRLGWLAGAAPATGCLDLAAAGRHAERALTTPGRRANVADRRRRAFNGVEAAHLVLLRPCETVPSRYEPRHGEAAASGPSGGRNILGRERIQLKNL